MRNIIIAFLLIIFLGCQTQSPDICIKPGQNINTITKQMDKAGYQETGLAMLAVSEDQELRMWTVGEGVLILIFSIQNGEVTGISYFLCDERPRATRKEFEFTVTEFYPMTREMKIELPDNPSTDKGK